MAFSILLWILLIVFDIIVMEQSIRDNVVIYALWLVIIVLLGFIL